MIFKSSEETWQKKIQAYVNLIESFKPDLAYAIAGLQEIDAFRFLRCARVRHASTLEQHGFVDIPFWLSHYSDYFEACTANQRPTPSDEVKRYSKRPTFLLPPIAFRKWRPCAIAKFLSVPIKKKPVEVAFVSRLEMFQKRVHWLPETIRRCNDLHTPLEWHIYGDGPERANLRLKLAEARNVTFHGWTDRATLYKRLPGHDLFFLCSRWEGLPIAMVEAMRCGLACVAPDIPTGIHWTLSHAEEAGFTKRLRLRQRPRHL